MNIVKTGQGRFVEIQGTAETTPFDDDELHALMQAADKGIRELIAAQKQALGEVVLQKPKA
jgi:ribonuclease PH